MSDDTAALVVDRALEKEQKRGKWTARWLRVTQWCFKIAGVLQLVVGPFVIPWTLDQVVIFPLACATFWLGALAVAKRWRWGWYYGLFLTVCCLPVCFPALYGLLRKDSQEAFGRR